MEEEDVVCNAATAESEDEQSQREVNEMMVRAYTLLLFTAYVR